MTAMALVCQSAALPAEPGLLSAELMLQGYWQRVYISKVA